MEDSSDLPPLPAAITQAEVEAQPLDGMQPSNAIKSIILNAAGHFLDVFSQPNIFGTLDNDPYTPSIETLFLRLRDGHLSPSPLKPLRDNSERVKERMGKQAPTPPKLRPLEDYEDLYYVLLAKIQDVHGILRTRLLNSFNSPESPIVPCAEDTKATFYRWLMHQWSVLNDVTLVAKLHQAVREHRQKVLQAEIMDQIQKQGFSFNQYEAVFKGAQSIIKDAQSLPPYEGVKGLNWKMIGASSAMINAELAEMYYVTLRVLRYEKEKEESFKKKQKKIMEYVQECMDTASEENSVSDKMSIVSDDFYPQSNGRGPFVPNTDLERWLDEQHQHAKQHRQTCLNKEYTPQQKAKPTEAQHQKADVTPKVKRRSMHDAAPHLNPQEGAHQKHGDTHHGNRQHDARPKAEARPNADARPHAPLKKRIEGCSSIKPTHFLLPQTIWERSPGYFDNNPISRIDWDMYMQSHGTHGSASYDEYNELLELPESPHFAGTFDEQQIYRERLTFLRGLAEHVIHWKSKQRPSFAEAQLATARESPYEFQRFLVRYDPDAVVDEEGNLIIESQGLIIQSPDSPALTDFSTSYCTTPDRLSREDSPSPVPQQQVYTKPVPMKEPLPTLQPKAYTKPVSAKSPLPTLQPQAYTKPIPKESPLPTLQSKAYTKPIPKENPLPTLQPKAYSKPMPKENSLPTLQPKTYTKPMPKENSFPILQPQTYTKPVSMNKPLPTIQPLTYTKSVAKEKAAPTLKPQAYTKPISMKKGASVLQPVTHTKSTPTGHSHSSSWKKFFFHAGSVTGRRSRSPERRG